jgi:protein TonB
LQPVRTAVQQRAPLAVALLTPPHLATLPPAPPPLKKPLPPRSMPIPTQPTPALPTLRPIEPLAIPPLDERPPPMIEPLAAAGPTPEPAPAPAATAAPASAPTTASTRTTAPTLSPPRFDADYLRTPPPEYPSFARRRGEEGRVLLRVQVNADGLPRHIEIRTSSGSGRLDEAALEAVRRWKFVPARRGDEAVEAWVLVPVAFSLGH